MAKTSAARTAKTSTVAATVLPARTRDASREVVTLETALRFAPTDDVSAKICKVFAMDPVPMAEIRETVEEHLVAQSRIMPPLLRHHAPDRPRDGFPVQRVPQ